MAVDKSLVSGSTTMLLLRLLEEKDMYGYEMIETLRARSQNVFELKAGTLYPLLHNLEQKKLLSVYEKEVGHKVLKEKKEEWETYSKAVVSVLNRNTVLEATGFKGKRLINLGGTI